MAAVRVTEGLLRGAWAQLRRRHPDWEPSFELAMQHPLHSRLVRATAVGLALRSGKAQAAAQRPAQQPHSSAVRPPQHHGNSPALQAGTDRKRAAAGDRD